MGDAFFRRICQFSETLGIERYEWLVGKCIYELHCKCIQDDRLIGCSGLKYHIVNDSKLRVLHLPVWVPSKHGSLRRQDGHLASNQPDSSMCRPKHRHRDPRLPAQLAWAWTVVT